MATVLSTDFASLLMAFAKNDPNFNPFEVLEGMSTEQLQKFIETSVRNFKHQPMSSTKRFEMSHVIYLAFCAMQVRDEKLFMDLVSQTLGWVAWESILENFEEVFEDTRGDFFTDFGDENWSNLDFDDF